MYDKSLICQKKVREKREKNAPFLSKGGTRVFLAHIFCGAGRLSPFAQRVGWGAWAGYSTGEKLAVRVMSSLTVSVRVAEVLPSDQEMN